MPAVDPIVGNAAASHMIGYLLNMILYGILLLQLVSDSYTTFFSWNDTKLRVLSNLYYLAFPKDNLFVKILVYSLVLIETLQTVMMMHDAVIVFGFGFGDPEGLIKVHLSWFSVPILSVVVSTIVQTFFVWRIWVLSHSILLPLLIEIIVLLQLGSGLAQGVFSYIINDYTHLPKVTAMLWLVSAAVCDVIIAVCMTVILARKQSSFKGTNVLVARVMRMTIETGALTAVMAVITAALDIGIQNRNYFVPPSWVLGKLYANNLLVIMNSRIQISGSRLDSQDSTTRNNESSSMTPSLTRPYSFQYQTSVSFKHSLGGITDERGFTSEETNRDDSQYGGFPLSPLAATRKENATSKEYNPFKLS
ncbi:hypothetical protein DL96DRAFT_1755894 [Flagelloscypha sp. PMI_526]|nr:hypothetical protein DL96DRAFT_1755894 [Flagelloscypha sp. PMI_526]